MGLFDSIAAGDSGRAALGRSGSGIPSKKKVLAVASGGGHWIQLLRMLPAFDGHEIAFVTTNASYAVDARGARFYSVNDASRWDRIGLVKMAVKLFRIFCRERPDLVVSTGAAPGYLSLRIGKLFGARTVWVDSIANAEEMSMSGARIGAHADLWLTQWPHLARPGGPTYAGAVL